LAIGAGPGILALSGRCGLVAVPGRTSAERQQETRMNTRHRLGGCLLGLLIGSLAFWGGCKREETKAGASGPSGPSGASGASAQSAWTVPTFDESALPFAIQTKIGAARREAQRASNDANKVADLGALCHVYGFPQVAVACFQRVTTLTPDDLASWYALGLVSERAGDTAQAITAYEKAFALKEDLRLARTRLAALLIEKDRTRAAEMLRRAVASDPNDAVAHTGLGLCALADGKSDEALQSFTTALKLTPNYGPAHAGLGKVLSAQGKTVEAAEQQRLAANDERLRPLGDPGEAALLQRGLDLEALLAAAASAEQRREFAIAEQRLREALDVEESGVRARTALGEVYGRQGKMDEAVREFEQVLESPAGKDYAPAKTFLAFSLILSKDFDRAERLLHEVLDKKPDDIDALRRLGALAVQLKAPEKALPALEAALAAAPRNADLHSQVGDWLGQIGKHTEAEAALRKAIELQPDLAPAHFRLGIELSRKGKEGVDGARQELTAALRLDPKLLPARLSLLQFAARAKDYAEMERLLREGVAITPGSPDLANALAWLLATCPEDSRRNGAQAIEWAEKACEATKHADHTMLDTLAAAYAAAGRFDEARKWIADAIKLAQASKQTEEIKDYEARQELYMAGKPYTENP
jgi:tetratricopeptide (TPR) repeat protein